MKVFGKFTVENEYYTDAEAIWYDNGTVMVVCGDVFEQYELMYNSMNELFVEWNCTDTEEFED